MNQLVVIPAEKVEEIPDDSGWAGGWLKRVDPALIIGVLALVVGVGFVAVSLAWNSGGLFAPLDDVYIHLQYGRQFGSGHFFEFNIGDGVSTGASSVLYAVVLGAAYAIGMHGTFLLVFAVSFNIVCFAVSAALIYLVASRLVHRTAGIWTGVLVTFNGPLGWGAASGMEVGLVMLLVTGLLLTVVTEHVSARFRYTPVVAALLAIARPEGLIFAAAITCAVLWTLWTYRGAWRKIVMVRRALWSMLPLALGAGQLLFYRLAAGSVSANGIQSKSLLHDRPTFYLGEFADRTFATLRALASIFLGFTNQDFAFPGALVVAAVGVGYLLLDRVRRPLVLATISGMVCVTLSLSTLDSALSGELRYFQPFLPVFLLFIITGVHAVIRLVPEGRWRRASVRGSLLIILVLSLVAMPTWAVRYAREAATIRDSDVSYAAWIKANLPADAVVAVKDVGAVAYLGGHRVVDLIGLGTNGLAAASNNGIGSLYEAIRRLPEAQRPDYFATYDTAPGTDMTPMRDAGILKQPAEAVFDVRTPPDLDGTLNVPFRQFAIYRADWTNAGSADAAPTEGDLRDYLNVGYLADEKAHSYGPRMTQTAMQPWTVLTRSGDTIDSGRVIMGGEMFNAHNLIPGRAVTLTARTAMAGTVSQMQVLINGQHAGTWTRTSQPGPWDHYTFTIPAALVNSSTLEIDIQPLSPVLNPYPHYTSYGYWLTQ